MKFSPPAILALSACLLSACALPSATLIQPHALQRLKGAQLAAVVRPPAPFSINTVERALGGAVVGIAAGAALGASPAGGGIIGGSITTAQIAEGQRQGRLVADPSIVADPALEIARTLAADLSSKRGMRLASATPFQADNPTRITHVLAAASGAKPDFVIDVRTAVWAVSYYPLHLRHYFVVCGFDLRLIDSKTGTVLAKGHYQEVPSYRPDSPTYDELTTGDRPGLKREVAVQVAHAVAHFEKNVLGL